jgi:hypothetical protein
MKAGGDSEFAAVRAANPLSSHIPQSSPAKAGDPVNAGGYWVPAFAGTTTEATQACCADHQCNSPTIAPISSVVSVPDTIDFNPSASTSSRRSGAITLKPPIMMPRLPKLAKPHIA